MEGSPGEPTAMAPPPPEARVTLTCNEDEQGVTIRLLPYGLMATYPDLLWQGPAVFGLWLLLAMTLLNGGPGAAAFFFIVVLPTFMLPAAWFLLNLHRAIQQGVIDVVDDRLVVSRYGVFGLEQDEWPLERLRSFRVVPTPSLAGPLLGRPPTVELQLETRRGMQYSFFAGRAAQELQWIAQTLERLVGIATTPRDDDAAR